MTNQWEKQRKYKRVFFSRQQGLTALFALPGIQSTIPVKIMDLSLGGMGCVLIRHPNLTFKEGDHLTLIELHDLERRRIPADIAVEIRWVIDMERFQSIGLGCRFSDTPPELEKSLQSFIEQGPSADEIKPQTTDSKDFVKKKIAG
ncbi:MAG: PilZ domain-containing protein [Desulfobacterales bacterium]|nr:PilZ domain-containing protein [Desulfobacterales bacterium]